MLHVVIISIFLPLLLCLSCTIFCKIDRLMELGQIILAQWCLLLTFVWSLLARIVPPKAFCRFSCMVFFLLLLPCWSILFVSCVMYWTQLQVLEENISFYFCGHVQWSCITPLKSSTYSKYSIFFSSINKFLLFIVFFLLVFSNGPW